MASKKKSNARKTSLLPTRIWKFAARFLTIEDKRRAIDLLYTSGRYYNRLVEIEQARVARFRTIRARYAPELAASDEKWIELDDKISEIYRKTRDTRQRHFRSTDGEKKRILPPDAQEKIDALKAEQERVSEAATVHRKAFAALLDPAHQEKNRRADERCDGRGPRIKSQINADVLAEMLTEDAWSPEWKEIARADDEAHAQEILARNECELPTGTYQKTEEAFRRAKKDSAPRPPRFHGLRPEGLLSVQWDKGTTYANLAIQQAPHDPTKKGNQSRVKIVHIDQSIPRGARQTVSATVNMHRAPPSDAQVKWSSWMIRRAGKQMIVELQLTLEHASFAAPKRPAGTRAPEHIQIGWAHVKGVGTRVAHWPGGGEVIVPTAILAQHGYASAITGAADMLFEKAKRRLRRVVAHSPNRLNAWHRMQSDFDRSMLRRACFSYGEFVLGAEKASEMWRTWTESQLRSHRDLYADPHVFREMFSLDTHGALAFWCFVWAKKDKHLSQFAIDSARRFEHRRDAFFRSEAIRIATEFSEITVDKYNIAELKKLDPITMPGETPRDLAQHQLHQAAPGRFREILREVMGPRCTPCKRPGDPKKMGGPLEGSAHEGDEEAAE